MLCINTEVKESGIPNAGKGLFSLEFAPKGSIIFIPTVGFRMYKLILEETYREELIKADKFPLNAGMRWAGRYFLHSDEIPDNSDYINHANNPNVLPCLGFFFALHDINCGDELTLNYRYIGIEERVELIIGDHENISGLSPKEALLQSAQKLISLLNEVEDIHCFDLPGEFG